MRLSYLKVALTFPVFLLSHFLFGQDYRNGYVVKNDGDSLKGFVHYVSGTVVLPHCSFKPTKESQVTEFTPSELSAFGVYGDNVWISMSYPGVLPEKSFVRVLVVGPMSLYRYGESFLVKKNELIVLPYPTKEVVTTPDGLGSRQNNKYVGLLNSLVADCGLTANTTKFNETQITNLVHNYNKCKGVKPAEERRTLSKLNYGFSIGYLNSSMTPHELPNQTFDPANTVAASLLFEYSSPRRFDRLFFTLEVTYFSASYFSHVEFHEGTGSNFRHLLYDATMKGNFFRLPIGLKYNFLPEKSTPYIKTGFAVTLSANIDAKIIREEVTATATSTSETTVKGFIAKAPNGLWVAVGYNRQVSKKAQLFFEARYDGTNSFFFFEATNSTPELNFTHMKNFSLSTGLRF